FSRIGRFVVEFARDDVAGNGFAPLDIAVTASAQRVTHMGKLAVEIGTRVLGKHRCLARVVRVVEQWYETLTLQFLYPRQSTERGHRGINIDELDQPRCADTGLLQTGSGDNERSAGIEIVVARLAPERVLAEVKAMVAPEHDHGVF